MHESDQQSAALLTCFAGMLVQEIRQACNSLLSGSRSDGSQGLRTNNNEGGIPRSTIEVRSTFTALINSSGQIQAMATTE
ncbi:hypothetical protein [Desulfobulbus propionicus]